MTHTARTGRRALLGWTASLGLAAVPDAGHAQDAPAPAVAPTPAPPVPSIATTPPIPGAGTPVPPRPAAAPAAAVPPGIDRTKAYYVYFDQTLDVNSLKALRRQCTALAEAGVSQITIVLHSTGGLIDPTLTTYGFLRALPCTIDTHALGFIASAANLLYMVGERRTADRNCRFLFHPTTVPITGTMNGGQMRDRLSQYDAVAAAIGDIYRDRAHFTPAELSRFEREEVIYTAEQARAGGIVQEVADLRLPGPDKARVLFLD